MLAAGGSSRLGRPKQFVPFRGSTLLEYAARQAVDSGAFEVIVVVGAHADEIGKALAGQPWLALIPWGRDDFPSAKDEVLETGAMRPLGTQEGRHSKAPAASRVRIVRNENWLQGMATSIRLGMSSLPLEAETAVLMTCDQTAVTAQHLLKLAELSQISGEPAASVYEGVRGVPCAFPRSWFDRLNELSGDAGARDLIRSAGGVQDLELPGGEMDVDLEGELP